MPVAPEVYKNNSFLGFFSLPSMRFLWLNEWGKTDELIAFEQYQYRRLSNSVSENSQVIQPICMVYVLQFFTFLQKRTDQDTSSFTDKQTELMTINSTALQYYACLSKNKSIEYSFPVVIEKINRTVFVNTKIYNVKPI